MEFAKKIPLTIAGFVLIVVGIIVVFYEIFQAVPSDELSITVWAVGLVAGTIIMISGLSAIWYGAD